MRLAFRCPSPFAALGCCVSILLVTSPVMAGTPEPPVIAGTLMHMEARFTTEDRAQNVSTCNTIQCRDDATETTPAHSSFCDTPPTIAPGAEGSCDAPATVHGEPSPPLGSATAFGCARFGVDQVSGNAWSMDDPDKLCLQRDCTGGLPCFDGHVEVGEVPAIWSQGATLELRSPTITVGASSDFSVMAVMRYEAQADRACLFGMALDHLCVEPDGSIFIRLSTWSETLTAPGVVPVGQWVLLEVHRAANRTVRVLIDGVDVTLGNPISTAVQFRTVYFMSVFKGFNAFAGQLAAAWLFNHELTDFERDQMLQYALEAYEVPSPYIFDDGFESGNTTSWARSSE